MPRDGHRVRTRPAISVAVVVGLGLALFGSPLFRLLDVSDRFSSSTTGSMLLSSALMWALVVVLLGVVLFWEQRSLSSIGLELPSRRDAAVGLTGGVAGLVIGLLATGIAITALDLTRPAPLSAIDDLSLPVKLVVVGTAVTTEEVLWRGYPIERLTELTGSIVLAATTSFLVFLAIHYPAWGIAGAIPQAVFALTLVAVYVETRNTVVTIITHTVINGVMVLLFPLFL